MSNETCKVLTVSVHNVYHRLDLLPAALTTDAHDVLLCKGTTTEDGRCILGEEPMHLSDLLDFIRTIAKHPKANKLSPTSIDACNYNVLIQIATQYTTIIGE